MQQHMFHLHALSALHVGTGQGLGVVDLPIARARATNLPLVPGSTIKGVLRDELNGHQALFGPASHQMENGAHAGALSVGDAQLLILPVRSFVGVVAFTTCPFILQRYARDLGQKNIVEFKENMAEVPEQSTILKDGKLLLEDLDQDACSTGTADDWAKRIAESLYPNTEDDAERWRKEFIAHFAILPDELFAFLAETATEIRARVRIDEDKRTVATGALWYEENLPAESVLWGVLGVSNSRKKDDPTSAQDLARHLPRSRTLQIGGKHTVGRGLCRWLLGETQTEDK